MNRYNFKASGKWVTGRVLWFEFKALVLMRRAVVWVSYRASFSLAYAAAKTFTTFVAS